MMKRKLKYSGSVFILSVFVIAMLSTLVMGMLKVNSTEIQLVRNRIWASQALALAEGGLNVAMAEMREDPAWKTGLEHMAVPAIENFTGGEYNVEIDGNHIVITASVDSWQGYTATIEAEVTVSGDEPHIIRIDNYRVNEPIEEE
jgi:hypothetical protein